MTLIKSRQLKDTDIIDCDYNCNYCGYPLHNIKVRKITGKGTGKVKHKGNVSTQVKCPNCHNFIKTWE